MPNDFVNTITLQNGTTYDIQDKRITATSADVGKVISVDSNGDLVLVNASSGTKLYRHVINVIGTDTDNNSRDLYIELISNDSAQFDKNTSLRSKIVSINHCSEAEDAYLIAPAEIASYFNGSTQEVMGLSVQGVTSAGSNLLWADININVEDISSFTDTVTAL